MDGNPLNQMSHAKTKTPPINSENSSYLNFPDYLDLYKNEAGINLFRYGPDNWAPSIWQNLDNPRNFAMNINGNLQGDIIISEAKQRDIKVMMSIFAFFPPYTSKEAIAKKNNQKVITQYLDYIIARYASNIDIWELANEALPSQEWQSFVSDYLSKNDTYHRSITISLENPQLKNSNLLSIHLYTHPRNNLELVEEIDKILQKPKEQNWSGATMFSELGFSDANYFTGSADLMRKISWILAMQKIGVVWWNVGDIFWQNGNTSNIYLGPNERTYLKELKQKLQFFGENTKIKQEISSQKNLAIYQLKNEQAELFYLVRLKHEQQIDKKFSIKTDKPSTLQIIDLQKNTVVQKLKINHQTSEILLPDFEDDLAVFLFKE